MSEAPSDPRLIYAPETPPDWSTYDERVTTIHLGTPGGDKTLSISLSADLATRFPQLTHLRLWNVDVSELPPLPVGLECLELVKCPRLTHLPALPASLEELLVDELPELSNLALPASFPSLWDISLKGCAALPQKTLEDLLTRSPALRWLDLSRCAGLTAIKSWPATLEKVILNNCANLKGLPKRWPAKLRRLELEYATGLSALPDFTLWPDYLNLAGTANLTHLGRPKALRTLFLHGSGIMVPPASEHGRQRDENVAERTLRYYDDIDLCGSGEVKRCKLLMLGNGGAGKTSLSLALKGMDAALAEKHGSTHGVQFWDRTICARVDGAFDEDVHLHLWDFGGQEIYHQTHRLFMSRGAVFVVLWDPKQDGCQPPPNEEGYQDEWRPLQYWLDFIHLACPWKPRIAIVCSSHSELTEELKAQFQEQVSEAYRELPVYPVNSWTREGQLPKLEEWLEENVGAVVTSQGTAVPAYWEIAQDLVGTWLPPLNPDKPTEPQMARYNEMSMEDFAHHLESRMKDVMASAEAEKFPELAAAMQAGSFELTPDRLRRTLEFLTNSGWLYWDEKLFDQRVIIGQQWALNGIYTVLDRREGSRVYQELDAADGQFTRPQLDEWIWQEAGYSEQQQELLLSFMRQVGVCFRLVSESDSYWREPVYKAFMHLPTARELRLQRKFDQNLDASRETIRCDLLHRGHWHEWLKHMGEIYGTDGVYARDGFSMINKDGQHLCVVVDFETPLSSDGKSRRGLGGMIEVQVAGLEAETLLEKLSADLAGYLPGGTPKESRHEEPAALPAGPKADRLRLFVSYTWNPRKTGQEGENLVEEPVTADYEEAVDLLENALEADNRVVEVLRDKSVLKAGDSIMNYIAQIKEAEKVLIVHSDKYWRSPYCMHELCAVLRSFGERPQHRNNTLLFLGLPNSGIDNDATVCSYEAFWAAFSSEKFPTRMRKVTTPDGLKFAALNLLKNEIAEIHDASHSMRWQAGKGAEFVAWVKTHLGLSRKLPKF